MKKIIKLLCVLVSAFLCFASIATLAGCSFFKPTTISVTTEEEFKDILYEIALNKTTTRTINIDGDLEFFAMEGFFAQNQPTWAKLNGVTLNGNGHTFIVKGDDGLLGLQCWGFFAELKDCKVSNLNIRYNMMPSASRNGGFGGLAQNIASSTIDNVHITFTKGLNYQGAGVNEVGGLAAYVQTNSTVTNCSVTGNVTSTGFCAGGLVGSLYAGSVLKNCSYEGKVTNLVYTEQFRSNEYRGYTGGLVGMCWGNISNCYILSKGLATELSTDSWRAVELDAGLFCGYLSGKMTNCYADIAADAVMSVKRNESTVFSRVLHMGFICGHVASSADIKNVYVDATKWELGDSTFGTTNLAMNIAFAWNGSTNIESVYYVDSGTFMLDKQANVDFNIVKDEYGSFTYNKNGDSNKPITVEDGRHLRLSMNIPYMDRDNGVVVDFIIDNLTGDWIYNDAAFSLNGDSTVTHAWPTVQIPGNVNYTEYGISGFDDFIWSISVRINLGAGTAEVSITKRHKRLNFRSEVSCVPSCSDVEFKTQEDVIGYDPNNWPWTTDENGKPIFKSNS